MSEDQIVTTTQASGRPDGLALALARLDDFFDVNSPWHQRLWDCGLVLGLRELSDAVEWVEHKTLSPGTLSWLARDLERLQGPDQGAGDKVLRQQLQRVLRSTLKHGNAHHRMLNEIITRLDDGYLNRWELAARDENRPPSPERFARAVGAHLLDAGFSQRFLHHWVKNLQVLSLADLSIEAQKLLGSNLPRTFDVLIPFAAVSNDQHNRDSDSAWRPAKYVNEWIRENQTHIEGRLGGGFEYTVTARDSHMAAEEGREIVDRLKARATYSRKQTHLRDFGVLIVRGRSEPFPLQRPGRGTFVLSLVREQKLYAVQERTRLDNALELAAPMNHGSIATAVSGGWSAVETLLLRGDDESEEGRGVLAADRMAALTACSWPRAELTKLSHAHKPTVPDRLAHQMSVLLGESTNRDRAKLAAEWINSGNSLALARLSDFASEERMRKLLASPSATLGEVKRHMVSAMRRLYRHRNLVMHGGATHLDTLSMTLRTVAPLVGAGLDRIAHAAIVQQSTPVELASRAELHLNLLRSTTEAPLLVDLLE
ncbi:integrase [Arthrobacter sp. 9V]|uniref:integrase n=1 Tax=Arthrobacter sp. 9V TaxID=2653132 RepID=UPI0013573872|nr:integrase [Arthrobacter sp. 9V]